MQTRNETLDLNFRLDMLAILSLFLGKDDSQWLRKGYLTISSTLHDSIFGRKHGAGEGIRTLDFNLGKVARYHGEAPFLNESLSFFTQKLNANCPATVPRKKRFSCA
jgi:hypothetical protein